LLVGIVNAALVIGRMKHLT